MVIVKSTVGFNRQNILQKKKKKKCPITECTNFPIKARAIWRISFYRLQFQSLESKQIVFGRRFVFLRNAEYLLPNSSSFGSELILRDSLLLDSLLVEPKNISLNFRYSFGV